MTDEQLNCLIDISLDLANDLFFYEDSIKIFNKSIRKASSALLTREQEIEKQSWITDKESYEMEANKIRKKMEILNLIIEEERKKHDNQNL